MFMPLLAAGIFCPTGYPVVL